MTDIDPLAKAVMIARCGWDPTERVTNHVEILSGDGTTLLLLPSLNVTAVHSVVIRAVGDAPDEDGYSAHDATIGVGREVGWKDNGELIWQGCTLLSGWSGVWPVGNRNITVTYDGGYQTTPDDLAAALASIGKRTATLVPQSRRMLNTTIAYAGKIAEGGLLTTEEMVLDRYRILRAK